jgi:CheY-like chemotaxis protein
MLINLNSHTLLIAEDDDLSFRYLEVVLKKKTEINIIRAANGMEAVELMKTHPEVNLVLMDLQLPIMTGFEAIKEIKKFSDVPIIVQTANAFREEEKKCKALGCTGFITKPISMDTLLNAVINNLSALPINN